VTDLPTRALSLKQPWAWAVFGPPNKDVENRVWWSTLRGPIWIAASAQATRAYYEEAAEIIERVSGCKVPPLDSLPSGCILGRATITDVALPGGWRWARKYEKRVRPGFGYDPKPADERHPSEALRWHFDDQYGYFLADRVALATPVPCKGLQRLWRVPAQLLEKLKEAA